MLVPEAKILFAVGAVVLVGLALWVVYINVTVKQRWALDRASSVPGGPEVPDVSGGAPASPEQSAAEGEPTAMNPPVNPEP